MAQLTDDCFAFSGPLLPLEDMERLIGERITPVAETERVPLHGARERVVAADVIAPGNLPPFDNSAVDGYAVSHADLGRDGDTMLAVVGRLTAGARADIALKSGQAIGSSPARRCRPAPIPYSCRKTSSSKATASSCRVV